MRTKPLDPNPSSPDGETTLESGFAHVGRVLLRRMSDHKASNSEGEALIIEPLNHFNSKMFP